MLVLLTRILLWASVGLLIWYTLTKIIDKKYLTWFGGVILVLLLVASFAAPDDGTIQIIWRILSFPLTPLGAAIVFLGASLSNGIKNIDGKAAAIALGILIFFSVPLSAEWLVSDAEQRVGQAYASRAAVCGEVCQAGEVQAQGNLAEAAAIVVFGNRQDITVPDDSDDNNVSINTPDEISVNAALSPRLIYAASLYRQARVGDASPYVIVTAGDGEENSNQQTAISNILEANNVPFGDIRIESTEFDIRETAESVEDLLEGDGLIEARDQRQEPGNNRDDPRVVIVAPAIVMSRAALSFERIGLQVIAKPTDFYTARFASDRDFLGRLPDILPSVDALQITTRYWNELLTSLYYFLRGWLPNFNFGWDPNIEV